jgi:2,3-bisphosphoglycerate-independent phosphoglycerate mutase
MDGWGINPRTDGNATAQALTPNLARFYKEYPLTSLDASGLFVGLPQGQMGNSEVGHLTIGAGRVIYQELTRINKIIEDGELSKNQVLTALAKSTASGSGALHLMGLVSDGGVHSHVDHLHALVDALNEKGVKRIFIHAFLDGRDTPPSSGLGYISALDERFKKTGKACVASVSGRFYAMDRDKRWDRVKKAYDALTSGNGHTATDSVSAVKQAYDRGETDEFVSPTIITGTDGPIGLISDNDSVLFFNFRADRARELTEAFISDNFTGFERTSRLYLKSFVSLTEYDARFAIPSVFKPQSTKNILGEVISRNGFGQFRVSETEKYAHVTFFFNGGVEAPFDGEDRFLIPSVKDVPTYDKKPEMRAIEIAEAAVEKIREGRYSFMLMNFANGDMVGHTGIMPAAIKACEAVDKAVGMVVKTAANAGWATLITADHGNCEQMIDYATGKPHTAHTTNPVPFIIVDDAFKGVALKKGGGLKNIAPTVLKLMGIEKPIDMNAEAIF